MIFTYHLTCPCADYRLINIEAVISAVRHSVKKENDRQEYFQWLHENRQIKIVRNEQGRIRTKGRKDYFQEYRILDTTHNDQELWVAYFHYETLESNTTLPTAAHLKVSDKYLATLGLELRQQLATLQPIDYVLRRITGPSTQSLFLALEPQPGVKRLACRPAFSPPPNPVQSRKR